MRLSSKNGMNRGGVVPQQLVIEENALEARRAFGEADANKLEQKPQPETLTDFIAHFSPFETLQRFSRVEAKIRCSISVTIITRAERQQLSWEEFYTKYPGSCGFICLSKIGLNSQKSEAPIAADWIWDPESGGVSLALMRKLGNEWKIVAERTLGVY